MDKEKCWQRGDDAGGGISGVGVVADDDRDRELFVVGWGVYNIYSEFDIAGEKEPLIF